ncbi:TolC family protein [Negadavirga shengliensis]|uniref:TolC family protein n=1 Tax=Negadavirga shengliensis TaxID=1389218 RepID=A0ABV9T3H0_9BACT
MTNFLFICLHGFAQTDENTFHAFDLNKDLGGQLPPLDELIDMAISNHPTIKLNEELIGSAEARVKLARKSWTNQLRGYFDYGYGNQVILATGPQGTGDLSNIANGYRAGANISFPLSEIFTRSDRISLQKHELSATYYKSRETELDIANQVIDVYNDLLLAQRLVGIRYTMQEKARVSLTQMEMDFKTGNIDTGVYMRNMEIYTIAQSEYENAKKNFWVAVQKLEILIGQPLENIIK